jgi:hypothetical protein
MMRLQLHKRDIVLRSRNFVSLRLFNAKYPIGDYRPRRRRFLDFAPDVEE